MEILASTKNGVDVYIDFHNSHAATHIIDRPELLNYAKKIISGLYLTSPIREEFKMDYVVGKTDLVTIKDGADVFYAKRKNRDTYIPFVKNVSKADTDIITLDIRNDGTNYYLYTIYVGLLTPGLPGGDREENGSLNFWKTHAIVYTSQELQEDTITTVCPW